MTHGSLLFELLDPIIHSFIRALNLEIVKLDFGEKFKGQRDIFESKYR